MIRNIASMGALNVYKSVVQFAMSLVVVHFVNPNDYGLVSFTMPFVLFVSLLTDLGLSSAVVRQPDLTRKQAGSAFTLVCTVGLILALVFASAAYPIAGWSRMRGLGPVMITMSAVVCLSVASTVPRALMERRLVYALIAKIEAGAVFISAGVGVICAWRGAGVWALVVYYVLLQCLRAGAFVWLSRKDWDLSWDWGSTTSMLTLGAWVLGGNVLNFLARNSDNVLIGAYIGAGAVGLYGLAYQFMTIPLMTIAWPASGVLLATLSRNAGDEARMKPAVEAIFGGTALVVFPLMAYLAIGLHYPVYAFLPPKWRPVVDLITVLAPVGAFQSIAAYNGALLISKGKAKIQFVASAINSGLFLATFLIALPFGLQRFVEFYAVVAAMNCVGFIWLMCWAGDLRIMGLLRALLPSVVGTSAALAVLYAAMRLQLYTLSQWLIGTAIFGIVVLAVYVAFRKTLLAHVHALTATAPVPSPSA